MCAAFCVTDYKAQGQTFSEGVVGTLAGTSVPEIDPGSAVSALALAGMGLSLLRCRRNRAV